MSIIILDYLNIVRVEWWTYIWKTWAWLTYVTVETWCDIKGDGKGEVAGGSVKTGLHVPSVSSYTDGLSTAPLVLRLDLLLTLKTHRILNRTRKKKSNFYFKEK